MIQNSNRILTIGPDPKAKGGIASVIAILSHMYKPFYLIITHKEISKIKKVFMFFSNILETIYFCLFKHIEIVHIHTSCYTDFYRNSVLLLICKLLRKKVLLHIHGSLFDEFYNTYPRYVTLICKKADALISVSNAFVNMLHKYKLNDHIYKLPNCIESHNAYRKEQRHDKLRLVFVGRIDKVKGIYHVLECLYKYKKELQGRIELHIGGTGDEIRFQKTISDYDISTMIIQHGWIIEEEKENLFCSSDVFIHPSLFESFGIAILEAMSYGLPVITTLIGGIPDFFENKKSGIAVTPGNVDEIYEAILLFLNNPSLIPQMGEYGKKMAQQFTPLQIESILQNIYKKLVG